MNLEVIQDVLKNWECETPSEFSGIYHATKDIENKSGIKNIMVFLYADCMGNCDAFIYSSRSGKGYMNEDEFNETTNITDEEIEALEHKIASLKWGVIVYPLAEELFNQDNINDLKQDMLNLKPYVC